MHRRFADWYELLAVTKNTEMLPLRWSAVEKLASSIETGDIPKLVRIFYLGLLPTEWVESASNMLQVLFYHGLATYGSL